MADGLEESYRVAGALFRQGVVISTDLLDAQADLTRARANVAQAAADYRTAVADWKRAIGKSAPGIH